MTRRIQAAGGILWRPAEVNARVEIALVHRRRQQDWSLPKGKANPGEHPVETALREVLEETGHQADVGPFLGSVCYRKQGTLKVVRYWSLEEPPAGPSWPTARPTISCGLLPRLRRD